MSNQYEVLGKARIAEDLKLSPNNVHLTIKSMNAGYGKIQIPGTHLFVSKAQSLC